MNRRGFLKMLLAAPAAAIAVKGTIADASLEPAEARFIGPSPDGGFIVRIPVNSSELKRAYRDQIFERHRFVALAQRRPGESQAQYSDRKRAEMCEITPRPGFQCEKPLRTRKHFRRARRKR